MLLCHIIRENRRSGRKRTEPLAPESGDEHLDDSDQDPVFTAMPIVHINEETIEVKNSKNMYLLGGFLHIRDIFS